MIAPALVERLRRELGADAVREHAALDVDGIQIAHTLVPKAAEQLPNVLRVLAEAGAAAIVRGGGNRLALGNAPARADLLLSTQELSGIEELDAEDGVLRARAGTTLAALRAAARTAGWELPLDAPGPGASLGGVLAAAEAGPRSQGYGRPRDAVLGLDVVLGSGEATRCGGRVVKNVTGYDLAKLYTGSLGALGVITAVWLRLSPRPERVTVLAGALESSAGALAAARRTSCRAAVLELACGPAAARRCVVELAGPELAVERDARELARDFGLREAAPEALDRMRRRVLASSAPLCARIPLLPAQLDAAERAFAETGATCVAWPGLGFVLAEWQDAGSDERADAEIARSCAALARAARGSAVVLRAPAAWKRARDVFGVSGGEIALTRALKQRFDPAGVLAPGRLPGRC